MKAHYTAQLVPQETFAAYSAQTNANDWSRVYLASEVDARIAELKKGLKDLIRAYVNTMENGRDRIVYLGGQCDPVDVMERGDPYLREAKKLLGL